MPSQIPIKSFNQQLGDMIRAIIAGTTLNDINAGSVLLTLLEAAAANDFENSTAILNILALLNIDSVSNSDLDSRAGDYGLSRNPAVKASGVVNIGNSAITKQSTGLYVIQPAPIAGQTVLYVNNTTGWASSGTLFVGRGTSNFEGPIPYTSITVFGTYSQINLGSALQNNHLISDTVINSQGQPDRIINAGTVVAIPANDVNPEIQYVTLRDAVLPAGEDIVTGVSVIAQVAGSQGNAGFNTITQFNTLPFVGATVTNTVAFTDGADVETDTELRNRIKNYSTTLARGTAASIVAAVIGISDPDDNKQVASAVITEPPTTGQPSILYIDDGTGFQPSYAGQSVDVLLSNAKGTEQFLQLSNYPVTRPQLINFNTAPFALSPGSFLRVVVDGVEESVIFESNQFINIASATLAEIIASINDQAKLFSARFTNNSTSILLYPTAFDAERFQVSPLQSADTPSLYANTQLGFPTNEVSYIALFQNSTRLREKAFSASISTASFGTWNISAPGDISIEVDGTPSQDRSFSLSDFVGASSFASLQLSDWVAAFNSKFAGLTAVATSAETMQISSNKIGSGSHIVVTGGSYLNNWFANLPTTSTGQTSQFQLNRQTGNLQILTTIAVGDSISAGVADARGFVISSTTISGSYDLSSDSAGRPSYMVVVPDSSYCDIRDLVIPVGNTIDISNPTSSVMRIMAPTISMFQSVLPGDYVFIASRTSGWVNSQNAGLFKIFEKGNHVTAGTDTYIDVENVNVVPQSGVTIQDIADVQAFSTDVYPQVWLGIFGSNPPVDTITDFVGALNSNLINVQASIFKTNSVKLTSTTESGGSIAIPVSSGPMVAIFPVTQRQVGNDPLIANRVSNKDLISFFKPTPPVSANVWLNRQTYSDQRGALTANAIPDSPPYSGPYSEQLQSTGVLNNSNVDYNDYIFLTRGNNRGQFRSIAAFIATDIAGTQEGLARTVINHTIGDEFEIVEPVQMSTDDTMVIVMNQDATNETIAIDMARTGQVNGGNGTEPGYIGGDATTGVFLPSTTEFSATDADNQPGIDFGNQVVWGTTTNGTNFSDYAVWMRAHNWYSAGGLSGGQGQMLVRSAQYGPNGNTLRFSLDYSASPNQSPSTIYQNTPSYGQLTYVFGSGGARSVGITNGTTISVLGPYPDSSTNFPNGGSSTGSYYDYTFSSGNFGTVLAGDIIAINPGSGVSRANQGQFRVAAVSSLTIRVFNANASLTGIGAPTVTSVTTVADVAGSLNGKYFLINDANGSVSVWYDVDNRGTPEPFSGALRSIKVSTVNTGDSATAVAAATAAVLVADASFTASNIANALTIDTSFNGNVGVSSAGTSGFAVGTTAGSLTGTELITNASSISIFPLAGNDVATIVATVNAGEVAILTAVGSTSALIPKATREEDYAYSGNSTALAYGHNPSSPNHYFIGLYDGVNWVKSFKNPNPNFTLKTAYTLQAVAPSIYSMDTAVNSDAGAGELFKLLPVTVQNVYHHMTQKALSQLPLVSTVNISNDRKNIQITSNNLGSAGAIEAIGGNANVSKAYLLNESENVTDFSGEYLEIRIPAFPDTFNEGDVIMLGNDKGVQRLSRLQASDSIDVTSSPVSNFEYNFNPKPINTSLTTTFTITDVSSIYGKPSGFVWRWTGSSDLVLTDVNAGDLVYAFGPSIPWVQGNKAGMSGDGLVSGLPIVNVDIAAFYFDVVNPHGSAMSSTAIGSGNTVQICPTPVIRWNLAHAADVLINSIVSNGTVVTINTAGPHYLNTGDNVNVMDSNNLADGTYGPVTVSSSNLFTFANVSSPFTENSSGASIIKTGLTPTRYRLEVLGVNGLARLQRQDGQSPHFTDCGVAVDDYVVITGSTFPSNNNGTFRVVGVDQDTLMLINPSATDVLNTIVPFNNNSLQPTWTSNTNVVSGIAGTFKYVNVGDWVKQSTDPDSLYLEVISMSPSTPSLATTITLGANYGGASAIAAGVVYDMLNNYDKGTYLKSTDDIAIYEGDTTFAGDTLTIQNIVNTSWFSPGNQGSFEVTETGTSLTTYRPFLRVINTSGIVETNRSMAVNTGGIYVTEGLANKFYSIRTIGRAALDDIDQTRRSLYTPQWSRAYKFTNSNGSFISHMGKLGYSTTITIGNDGYTYYTGLLQKVQHIVDGYEPDIANFPGQRAVGGLIETLPPLILPITIALTVATNNGVNLNDISDQIKSSIISYIEGLGVGTNVVLSQIIANVMQINGVASVVFTTPVPSTASITVGSNQKATISASDIGIS